MRTACYCGCGHACERCNDHESATNPFRNGCMQRRALPMLCQSTEMGMLNVKNSLELEKSRWQVRPRGEAVPHQRTTVSMPWLVAPGLRARLRPTCQCRDCVKWQRGYVC
jgi:hypothetical protein